MLVSSFDLVIEKVIGSGLILPLKTNNKMIEILSYQFLTKITEEVTSVSLWMKLLMCPSWNSSVSVTIISTVKEQSRKDFQSSHKKRRQMTDGAFLNEKLKSA
jgi:hypothetical protein